MATVFTIGGVTKARTGGLILDRLTLALDRPDEMEFTQFATSLPGAYSPETAVTLSIGGTLVFTGSIYSRALSGFTTGIGNVGYRCIGLKYRAYLIPVTAADGTGILTYNLPTTDASYVASQSGLSVGTILSTVFGMHATALSAVGITSFVAGDLTPLTVVPPEPVILAGNCLWTQIDGLLQTWYGNRYASYVTPAGVIRIIDTTTLTPQTLTFGTDPVLLGSISEDTAECYTQVVLRGRSNVEPAYLSLHDGTLIDPHSASGDNAEASWSMSKFLFPTGAYSVGAITVVTSTQVTIQSDNSLETWGVNYWSGKSAQISMINPASATISFTEYRRITANTALTAGGTSVITLDHALVNSGYTRYQIRGTADAASESYRRLNIANAYVAQHLTQQFNFSVPWSSIEGAIVQTNFPVGVVCWTSTTGAANAPFQTPLAFEVIPYDGTTNGYIRAYQPWVSLFNNAGDLADGGASVVQATDIQVLVPYSRGTLTAQAPSSGYSGTAYTRFGVQRTLYRDYPTWFDFGSTTNMTTLAGEILKTVSNVVQEGSVTYFGLYSAAMTNHVAGTPICLNLANWTGTISFESLNAPVREVSLEMPQSGAAGWITRLRFSTRRQQYSADQVYVHPMFQGGAAFGAFNLGTMFGAYKKGGTPLDSQTAMKGLEEATKNIAAINTAMTGGTIGQFDTGTIFADAAFGPLTGREMKGIAAFNKLEFAGAAGARQGEADARWELAVKEAPEREARAAERAEKLETQGGPGMPKHAFSVEDIDLNVPGQRFDFRAGKAPERPRNVKPVPEDEFIGPR